MNPQEYPIVEPQGTDYNQTAEFRRYEVQPPGALYITVDELIQLSISNPSQTVSLNFSMRMLLTSGNVAPVYYQYPNLAPGSTPKVQLIPGVEGYLLSCTVDAPTISRGAAYVVVTIRRGRGSSDTTAGDLLCEGYPGGLYLLNYPFSLPEPPTAGAGLGRSVTVTSPAAGADWSVTVPAGAAWQLNSVSARLVTSATVANRAPALVITDGSGNVVYNGAAAYVQTAGLTWSYSWSAGGIAPPSGTSQNGGTLPASLRLQPGWTIKTVTSGIQAADQWSQIVLGVQEYAAS